MSNQSPSPSFTTHSLRFRLDRDGAEVEGDKRKPIEAEPIAPDVVGLDGGDLAEELGQALSRLMGARVSDDEGIFDLAVERDGVVVAALVLSCSDDDMIELSGERSPRVTDGELREAIEAALSTADLSAGIVAGACKSAPLRPLRAYP